MEELSRFLLLCLYAQGAPLLVCLVTFYLDWRAKGKILPHFPNMGVHSCFLGQDHGTVSYLGSSRFLYFDIFLLAILVTNLFFLCHISLVLHRAKQSLAAFRSGQEQERFRGSQRQAVVVARLFVIMGGIYQTKNSINIQKIE